MSPSSSRSDCHDAQKTIVRAHAAESSPSTSVVRRIDHRLRSEGFLERLEPADIGLYPFLTLAADRRRTFLLAARSHRTHRALLRTWHAVGCPDTTVRPGPDCLSALVGICTHGSYQVLSVQRRKDTWSPDGQPSLTGTVRDCQA